MRGRRLLLLVLVVLVVLVGAVVLLLAERRLGYGTSCTTGERCERPTDGVRVVGSATPGLTARS